MLLERGKKIREVDTFCTSLDFQFENRSHSIQWKNLHMVYFFSWDIIDHCGHSANNLEGDYGHEDSHIVAKKHIISKNNVFVVTIHIDQEFAKKGTKRWINFRWFNDHEKPSAAESKIPIATEKIEIIFKDVEQSLGNTVTSCKERAENRLDVRDNLDCLEIYRRGDDGSIAKCAVLDKSSGWLSEFCDLDGRELLSQPLRPNFSRAATDNDRGGIDRMIGESM